MLASLIAVNKIKQRRPRKDADSTDFHRFACQYNVLIVGGVIGIDKARLERIQKSLTTTGLPPTDKRGKHTNRTQAFKDEKVQSIIDHIRSFRDRQSHYTLKESKKLYLREDLCLNKMYQMYMTEHPGEKCCRESYRQIFIEKFNVAFGYPRKDTCPTCDHLKCERVKEHPSDHLRKLAIDQELHWRKCQTFNDRKTSAVLEAQSTPHLAVVAFDFWKNLPCPNITTNDTYYRRQLSLYSFNVHNLGTGDVHLFVYDEIVGRKGSNDVSSMLFHYFINVLPPAITHIQLFCDSCAGQTNNWTMFRFLPYIVHHQKRFQEVWVTFPHKGPFLHGV